MPMLALIASIIGILGICLSFAGVLPSYAFHVGLALSLIAMVTGWLSRKTPQGKAGLVVGTIGLIAFVVILLFFTVTEVAVTDGPITVTPVQ